ncbi:hypothetical protein Aph01nite_77370 [Acrocarpospora phusangensis]|uniref:Uncharacterized protein n=2 Tax=Acrocarpospora phusangensis TaxID=1070424 RepID=A0A919QNL7_9ACTN|nr:hypothetical protein Aph01nite_77370 [Acrocarpospora phusangensis]
MAIAAREAARFGMERSKQAGREVVLDQQLEKDERGGQASGPDAGDQPGWLGEALEGAFRKGAVNRLEFDVVRQRLAQPGITWAGISELLGVRPEACAVAHCRAVPKLRVFLFTEHAEDIGGLEALEQGFGRAGAARRERLSASEAEAFRLVVLEKRAYRRRGWQGALRAACTKVARYLPDPWEIPAIGKDAPTPRVYQVNVRSHPPGGAE